jgi:malate dehydrogenase (oxaloacetate-decarboxylating)(NADP+)
MKDEALDYHARSPAGKVGIALTKPTDTIADLSLAYTPGVAEPVRAIMADPTLVYRYTAKGNLVGVISNGSAVLGLGDCGPLAAKPVMEGKAVLLKRLAQVDAFDIEISASTVDEMVTVIRAIAPTFGGINLEDIKAPLCFEVEECLQASLDIPVFHDDQHGTAVVIAAALENAIFLQGKQWSDLHVVCIGAGAAGIASMRLLQTMGVPAKHCCLLDSKGVVHKGRSDLNKYKKALAIDTPRRTLADALVGADVVIGLAGPGIIPEESLKDLAPYPIIFALSNPDPEIYPSVVHRCRPDAMMATGRSDFPNQVNNALFFPYLFRGLLDARAQSVSPAILRAGVQKLAELGRQATGFGPKKLLPALLDPSLIGIAEAVSQAVLQEKE